MLISAISKEYSLLTDFANTLKARYQAYQINPLFSEYSNIKDRNFTEVYIRLKIVCEVELKKTVETKGSEAVLETLHRDHSNSESASKASDFSAAANQLWQTKHREYLYNSQKEVIAINETALFQQRQEEQKKEIKHLLLEGQAGVGKSTWCKHVGALWAGDDVPEWLGIFDLVLVIPLRDVLTMQQSSALNASFDEATVLSSLYAYENSNWPSLLANLRASSQRVLYILDGYDEIAESLENNPLLHTLIAHWLEQPYVIVTTRPSREIQNYKIDRRLHSQGFNSEDVLSYITHYFASDSQKAAVLCQLYQEQHSFSGLMQVPIILELICFVAQKEADSSHFYTMSYTGLYDSLLIELSRYYLSKRGYQEMFTTDKALILDHYLVFSTLSSIEQLALIAMDRGQITLQSELIREHLSHVARVEQVAVLERFGMLTVQTTQKDILDRDYCFIHLSFQEYLAARAWVRFWESSNLSEHQAAEHYFKAHKYECRFELVWRFAAGLINQNSNKIENFIQLLEEPPREIIGARHQVLMTNALSQWGDLGIVPAKTRARLLKELTHWVDGHCDIDDDRLVQAICLNENLKIPVFDAVIWPAIEYHWYKMEDIPKQIKVLKYMQQGLVVMNDIVINRLLDLSKFVDKSHTSSWTKERAVISVLNSLTLSSEERIKILDVMLTRLKSSNTQMQSAVFALLSSFLIPQDKIEAIIDAIINNCIRCARSGVDLGPNLDALLGIANTHFLPEEALTKMINAALYVIQTGSSFTECFFGETHPGDSRFLGCYGREQSIAIEILEATPTPIIGASRAIDILLQFLLDNNRDDHRRRVIKIILKFEPSDAVINNMLDHLCSLSPSPWVSPIEDCRNGILVVAFFFKKKCIAKTTSDEVVENLLKKLDWVSSLYENKQSSSHDSALASIELILGSFLEKIQLQDEEVLEVINRGIEKIQHRLSARMSNPRVMELSQIHNSARNKTGKSSFTQLSALYNRIVVEELVSLEEMNIGELVEKIQRRCQRIRALESFQPQGFDKYESLIAQLSEPYVWFVIEELASLSLNEEQRIHILDRVMAEKTSKQVLKAYGVVMKNFVDGLYEFDLEQGLIAASLIKLDIPPTYQKRVMDFVFEYGTKSALEMMSASVWLHEPFTPGDYKALMTFGHQHSETALWLNVCRDAKQNLMAEMLFKNKALSRFKDFAGKTALFYLVQQGQVELAKWLVDQDPSTLDDSYTGDGTLLHLACRLLGDDFIKRDFLAWLLVHLPKKQMNQRDGLDNTVLMVAVINAGVIVVDYLLSSPLRGNLSSINKNGDSALTLAHEFGSDAVYDRLLELSGRSSIDRKLDIKRRQMDRSRDQKIRILEESQIILKEGIERTVLKILSNYIPAAKHEANLALIRREICLHDYYTQLSKTLLYHLRAAQVLEATEFKVQRATEMTHFLSHGVMNAENIEPFIDLLSLAERFFGQVAVALIDKTPIANILVSGISAVIGEGINYFKDAPGRRRFLTVFTNDNEEMEVIIHISCILTLLRADELRKMEQRSGSGIIAEMRRYAEDELVDNVYKTLAHTDALKIVCFVLNGAIGKETVFNKRVLCNLMGLNQKISGGQSLVETGQSLSARSSDSGLAAKNEQTTYNTFASNRTLTLFKLKPEESKTEPFIEPNNRNGMYC